MIPASPAPAPRSVMSPGKPCSGGVVRWRLCNRTSSLVLLRTERLRGPTTPALLVITATPEQFLSLSTGLLTQLVSQRSAGPPTAHTQQPLWPVWVAWIYTELYRLEESLKFHYKNLVCSSQLQLHHHQQQLQCCWSGPSSVSPGGLVCAAAYTAVAGVMQPPCNPAAADNSLAGRNQSAIKIIMDNKLLVI